MQNSLYVGLSGQLALQRKLELVANNVANMNTVGFRSENAVFTDYLTKAEEGRKVSFVVDRSTYTDMRPGTFQKTGNDLDVAVSGDGWLQVGTAQGVRYTRDGRMNLDAQGQLVSVSGDPVLDTGGQPIEIPDDVARIDIRKDGSIVEGDRVFGRIGLARFNQLDSLQRQENGLYRTDEVPQPAEQAELVQGMVESSNVRPILEMTEMINLSRAYEQASAMAENSHNVERKGIDKLGSVS